jgi:tripartite-type tricarboxylate transporter receptor subunit TctC
MKMRSLLTAAAIALAATTHSAAAATDAYPTDVVRLVVGSSPGGTADTVSRLLAAALSDRLGQTFVVENMPGAGGALASANVRKAAPDGYSLLFIFSSFSILPSLNKEVGYDPVADFTPISEISSTPNILVANPAFGVSTLGEWVDKIKANPGKFDYGSGGIGYSQHLSMEMMLQQTGGQAVHIPYAGSGKLIAALLANEVPFAFEALTAVAPHIESGALVPLGVTSTERSPILPNVPAIGESVKGYKLIAWNGLVAPAGTPRAIVDKLNAAVADYLSTPEAVEFFGRLGTTISPSTPEGFAALIKDDREKFAKVIEAAGIKAE